MALQADARRRRRALSTLTAKEECLDRGLSKMMSLEMGQALPPDSGKRGVVFDAVLGSALMKMYGKCVGSGICVCFVI